MTPDPFTMGEDSLREEVVGSWNGAASSAGPVVRGVTGLEQARLAPIWSDGGHETLTHMLATSRQHAFVCNNVTDIAPCVRRCTCATSGVVHLGEPAKQYKALQA
jgi:hypothetical protein